MVRDKGLSFYSRKKKVSSGLFIEIITWIFGIVFSVFLAGVLVYFFGMTTRVVGESMEPTLYNEQTVLVDRLSYIFSSPYGRIYSDTHILITILKKIITIGLLYTFEDDSILNSRYTHF